jgi:stage III sporulation protein SpoIIIAA
MSVERREVTSNIDLLLEALPPHIQQALLQGEEKPEDVLEIVLDLGRLPEARYPAQERFLSDLEITREDIEYVTSRIGDFGEDNRAGIPRTLHRISAIRNRKGVVIGLTCRVGRAVFGTVSIIRDLIESGQSILLLGRPGTGKTTLLRETARVLAEEFRKRVVIVDTSNEIAGDGDIPHPGIGRARRMQVPRPAEQHAVMIEAVENHMPEVIVIDEIGTELEAQAARTIAERGVQLIGTAHGNSLDNLMLNPTLSDLIGGIQAVTLGDEEARRRGTQKTVLERKAPPTFDVLVEIQSWDSVAVYADVSSAVDAILRGEEPQPEQREKDADGQVTVTQAPPHEPPETVPPRRNISNRADRTLPWARERERDRNGSSAPAMPAKVQPRQRIFPFGVSRNRLENAIDRLHVPAVIVRDMHEATLVMTLKNYYRQSAQRLRQAEERGIPVYVLRNNTITQMERQLATIFQLNLDEEDQLSYQSDASGGTIEDAMLEAETAITQVMNGERSTVELAPRSSYIRRLQHQMADRYSLDSRSYGSEPYRGVKIFRS